MHYFDFRRYANRIVNTKVSVLHHMNRTQDSPTKCYKCIIQSFFYDHNFHFMFHDNRKVNTKLVFYTAGIKPKNLRQCIF